MKKFNNNKEPAKNREDPSKRTDKNTKESSVRTLHCYNCGEAGHKASNCKHKDQGKKCFRCNKFGHEASACKSTSGNNTSDNIPKDATTMNLNIESRGTVNSMCKEILIDNIRINALIDTGS